MNRRDFLRNAILAGAGLGLAGCRTSPGPSAAGPDGKIGRNRFQPGPVNGVDLAVAKGKPAAELVAAALGVFGGMAAFVKAGDRVLLKPNIGWSRTPEQAACTSPEVLAAVIAACQGAGAKEVLVADHSCDASQVCFDLSGAAAVCKQAGVPLIDWSGQQVYREVQYSKGQTIRTDQVPSDLLDCDVYINLPTLKHHSATLVTLALKNQMGAIFDRGRYHAEKGSAGEDNLHRNIVDLATGLRPTLNILDATRALKTNGPKGPGLVEEPGVVCASPNIVAVDAYGARLLGHDPAAIAHLVMASAAGLGSHDLASLVIREA